MYRHPELLPTTSPPWLGGALQRIFQLLRYKIDHHLPPCTAVVWLAAHAPNRKGAKELTKRCQALRLGLRPGRLPLPPAYGYLLEEVGKQKFAEPSNDLHP